MSPNPPAGWYPDGQGGQRYWDGRAWTDYTQANYWRLREQTDVASKPEPTAGNSTAITHEVIGKPWYRMWQVWVAIALLSCCGFGLLGTVEDPEVKTSGPTDARTEPAPPSSSPSPERTAAPTPSPTATTKPVVVLLYITDQKDGDSFVASDGREYRLGLVNTPEASEQCGSQAAAFTREFLAGGFTADAYSSDTYDRRVAEVFNKSGKSLNVALAKSGLGNDRYLEEFRHENPDLGRRLDAAFASAATPSCRRAVAPVPLMPRRQEEQPASDCMAGYSPCLPIRPDMNCPDIGHPVTVTGSDPYGLDRDRDGIGCD